MKLKMLVYLTCLALVAAACSNDGGDDTTTDAPGTTEGPTESQVAGGGRHFGCLIAGDLIAVPADGTQPFGDDDSLLLLDRAAIMARIDSPDDMATTDAIDAVLAATSFYELQESSFQEVAAKIKDLRDQSVLAEAVYGIAFEGHWGLEPGAVPYQRIEELPGDDLSAFDIPELTRDEPGPLVGVVDSGFPSSFKGLEVGLTEWDQIDVAPSHGMFVTSVIRRLAPEAKVWGAKPGAASNWLVGPFGQVHPRVVGIGAASLAQFKFSESAGDSEAMTLSDELAISIAISRLKFTLGPLDFLNLSLGTYGCGPDDLAADFEVPAPAIIRRHLDENSGAVYAAAGNESLPASSHDFVRVDGSVLAVHGEPFYPANYDPNLVDGDPAVVGVAALESGGNVITWGPDPDNGDVWIEVETQTRDAKAQTWIDQAALGIGMIGFVQGERGVWSGASFATAVATALATIGSADLECPDGLSYLDANGDEAMC